MRLVNNFYLVLHYSRQHRRAPGVAPQHWVFQHLSVDLEGLLVAALPELSEQTAVTFHIITEEVIIYFLFCNNHCMYCAHAIVHASVRGPTTHRFTESWLARPQPANPLQRFLRRQSIL